MLRKGRLLKVKEWGRYCNEIKVCEEAQRGIEAGTEFLLRTDKNGFIITGNQEIPAESLAVLGDSFTECLFVRERLRFCSVCERILRRNYSPSFSVLNAAMSGANIFHCNITLLAKIVPLRPKFVLLCLPSIDDKTLRMPDGYWNSDKNVSIFYDPSFERAPLLQSADYAGSGYLAMIKLFFNILDAFSLRGAVCLRPFYRLNDRRHEMNGLARDFCRQNGYPCIDLNRESRDVVEKMFYDNIHLNQTGSVLFGRMLAAELLRNNFLADS